MLINNNNVADNAVDKKGKEQLVMGSVSDVARRVSPSIVGISNLRSSGDMFNRGSTEATGSGVIYDRSGHIITNYHVIREQKKLIVTLADGSSIELLW